MSWTNKLAARLKLRSDARRSVAWWTARARQRGLTAAERKRRREMLAVRVRLLATREAQVAFARRVIARQGVKGVSAKGTAFIAAFEGGQSPDGLFRPYRDPVGVWTIGYGHTQGVSSGSKPMTKTQALALLRKDLNEVYCPPVLRAMRAAGMPLKQGVVDALTSASYNLGPGVLVPGRSLGDAIRSRSTEKIANALLLYDKAGGRVLPGLTRRRQAEAAMVRSA